MPLNPVPTRIFSLSRPLTMMKIAIEVGAVAVVTFKSLVSSVKVVVAGAEAEERSLSMIMTSPLFELAATAHAAASKVNVKCLSRFTHACRCE